MSKVAGKDQGDVWYQSGIVSFGSSVGCEVIFMLYFIQLDQGVYQGGQNTPYFIPTKDNSCVI